MPSFQQVELIRIIGQRVQILFAKALKVIFFRFNIGNLNLSASFWSMDVQAARFLPLISDVHLRLCHLIGKRLVFDLNFLDRALYDVSSSCKWHI